MTRLLFFTLSLFISGLSVYAQTQNQITRQVEDLLSKMTLEEKINELTQDAPANQRLGIPFMRYSECLHGLWLEGATVYPQAIALGATWEPELIREMTEQIAKEARAVNITHCYSPNLDLISGDARYGRVEESYGEDPYLVSRMGVAFIEGLQGTGAEQYDENHILATAKHFVGYPENRRGINGGFSDMSERRLTEVYLPPFEAAVKEAQVGCIMPGHQDLNGILLHMNGELLNGRYTQMGGYSGIPPYYTSVLEGITEKVGGRIKVNYALGCELTSFSKEGFAEAIAAAEQSDMVILAVGGSTETCGEGTDRASLDLFGAQNALVEAIHKTGKPIVVVLLNGRPLAVNYIAENIPAVIEGWYLGMRTGEALADVLFGDYNPGGKLTVSFPRSVGHLPVTYLERPDFVGSGKGLYKFSDKSPLFPFGYGLSYTTLAKDLKKVMLTVL